jgi:hypothetical protein
VPSPKNDITIDFVLNLLDYKEKTGELYWKKTVSSGRKSRGGNSRSGKLAGRVLTNGYRYIYSKGRWYLAHRLIFLIVNGKWPPGKIDHYSKNKLNNKKIRPATNSQNCFNRGKSTNNTSGFKGVTWHAEGKKWRAQIAAYGQYKSLGLFKTKKAAHAAYCKAAKELHKEFANFG